MFEYRKATIEDLERIWDKDIAENAGDPRYPEWKTQFINANKRKKIITFVVVADGDPVGQATLVLLKDAIDSEIKGILCNDRDTAYISTVRIEKQFEAQGHISKLFKLMEKTAADIGIKYLTIGCEAKMTRNLAIYLHFGYTEYLTSITDDGDLILFFRKALTI